MAAFLNVPEGVSSAITILIILTFIFGTRIVRALLVHQQKMAEIIQRNQSMVAYGQPQDVDSIRREVELLKATVNQQTIMLDTISRQQQQALEIARQHDSVEQRL